jgi:hypothetical protein
VETDVDDQTVRAGLKRHWEASDADDFSVEHEIYREDAVLQQIFGSGDLWVTEFILTYDGAPSYTVSIMEFLEGQVAHEIQYFANAFDPAPSRASRWANRGARRNRIGVDVNESLTPSRRPSRNEAVTCERPVFERHGESQ